MDANFVMTDGGDVVGVQAISEEKPLPWSRFMALKTLANQGVCRLAELQRSAIEYGVAAC
jgi:ribonuclease PH